MVDQSEKTAPLLHVKDLVTAFDTEGGQIKAVDGVSFSLQPGRTLGIVGESGCGKTVTALSIINLLPKPTADILEGEIWFEGEDLASAPIERLHDIRGERIGMIFQEPMTALNPVHRVGRQIMETLKLHRDISDADALRATISMLEKVGIPSPEVRVSEYPHQLSGGMRQRVMIAMALICDPSLVIADEPTTALDVTIQAQILELLQDMQNKLNTSVIMITHDLGVIAETCDDVLVMYAGRVAEQGSVDDVFNNPMHPYTQGLLSSIPRLNSPRKTKLPTIEGMVPSLTDMPTGCRFNNRCPYADELCVSSYPQLDGEDGFHQAACHHWRKIDAQLHSGTTS
ncbi:MAG: ABC transporter ATP-binding protein [Pseudomonadaceae bacterium]|nr:ABC transporter ATP-binding protein [Pseudomonadaceae bacterium]